MNLKTAHRNGTHHSNYNNVLLVGTNLESFNMTTNHAVTNRLVSSCPFVSSLEGHSLFLQHHKDRHCQTLLDILPSVRNSRPQNHPKYTTCSQTGKTFCAHHSFSFRGIVEEVNRHIVSWGRDKMAESWIASKPRYNTLSCAPNPAVTA